MIIFANNIIAKFAEHVELLLYNQIMNLSEKKYKR